MPDLAERERVLEEMVRDWARPEFGPDPTAIDRAVGAAMSALESGSSVPEAWDEACAFLNSWSRHPSNGGPFHLDSAA
ncbi:MAG: hypothetical protein WB770_05250 [Acidimicrobiales bacterium]